jgi:hypothetical protein
MRMDRQLRPGDPPDGEALDEGPTPTFVPQPLLTALSVLIVLALILGSAGVILALTDWGITAGAILGLTLAAVLVVIWLRMPARGGGV